MISILIKYIQRLCEKNKIMENHKLIFNKHSVVGSSMKMLNCCFYMSLKNQLNEQRPFTLLKSLIVSLTHAYN